MAFGLDGFSEAILSQLSQIGVELISDNSETQSNVVPKAIYQISTGKEVKSNRNFKKNNPKK